MQSKTSYHSSPMKNTIKVTKPLLYCLVQFIMLISFLLLLVITAFEKVDSFTLTPPTTIAKNHVSSSSTTTTSSLFALLNLELEKPLGIILEEMEEGGSEGVKVEELSDAGSAYASDYRDQLVGLKVAKVMDNDVTSK